jgi:hypothetical protein
MRDTELVDIGNFLKNLVLKNPKDVRIVIQKFKEDINRNIRKGNLNPFKDININDYV